MIYGEWAHRLAKSLLAGCESGTITGQEQSCRSSGGLFGVEEISCTGTVAGVRGSPHLTIVEADEELDVSYRLDATIAVARGTARANVTAADGEQVGGEVTPEAPLQMTAVIEPGGEEEIDAALKVVGKEVRDLRYEATLVRQDWRREPPHSAWQTFPPRSHSASRSTATANRTNENTLDG